MEIMVRNHLMVQSVTLECESSAVCPHPGVPVHGFGVVLGDDRPILPISHRQFCVGECLTGPSYGDRKEAIVPNIHT
jgi:hypothetical protein